MFWPCSTSFCLPWLSLQLGLLPMPCFWLRQVNFLSSWCEAHFWTCGGILTTQGCSNHWCTALLYSYIKAFCDWEPPGRRLGVQEELGGCRARRAGPSYPEGRSMPQGNKCQRKGGDGVGNVQSCAISLPNKNCAVWSLAFLGMAKHWETGSELLTLLFCALSCYFTSETIFISTFSLCCFDLSLQGGNATAKPQFPVRILWILMPFWDT